VPARVREPTEAGEAGEHHRPGRGFWDGFQKLDVDRAVAAIHARFHGLVFRPWPIRIVAKSQTGKSMQKLLGALTAAALFIAAYGDAAAFPVAVLKAAPGGDIVPVAQGCGPGGWRGPWGHCRYTPFSGRMPGGGYASGYNGCPPGSWRGPWGHCRNTPFHGRHPDGSWY
jgi:hypothetical protein